MALCLLLLKEVSLSMGPPNAFPQFLDILGGSGFSYQFWGKFKSDVERESGLSPIHEEIGTVANGRILGTVVSGDQHSNTALPVRLAFWRHPQHINWGGVELNLSHWPFVWGWYGLILSFLVPINLQRLAVSSLSKFLPWSKRIFSGNA